MNSSSPLRVVTTLPNLVSYRDRVLPLIALSQLPEIGLIYLLTSAEQDTSVLLTYPKLKVIEVPRQGYLKWISRWVIERLEAETLDVVHDCFGHLVAAFEYPRMGKNHVLLTVQYTTNWGWFQRVKPLGYRLNLRYAYLRAHSLWLDARVTRAADRVVILGPGHEQDLQQGHHLQAQKITLIPPEIDCERFYPLPSVKHVSEEQPKSLLYTGAISRNKGIDLLFDVFQALTLQHPHLQLTLIGQIPPFEQTWFKKALAQHPKRSHISVLGQLPQHELISYYQKADLYLFPSRFEGAPRTLREAVACGCVCVSADLPGCRGIDPDGHFIHFVSEHTLDAWTQALHSALSESFLVRKKRSTQGVFHLKTKHSPQVIAQHYLSLYQELIQERKQHQPFLDN